MKIPAWLRRNRAVSAWPAESERLAVTTVYPGTILNPGTTQWPDTCAPGDPCRVIFSNEADRGEWYDCPNHVPRGRHHATPPEYSGPPVLAVVTDLPEESDCG